ncbi:MAG: hypothetical protein CUN53_01440 [Phototrophicales bacterium]|nr:MAG: hypothetical protein CUN53_01440 [Phototrophicales bacterium]
MAAGLMVFAPQQVMITHASFDPAVISPNADSEDDVTIFTYTLTRGAIIDIVLESDTNEVFFFRRGERRAAGNYTVAFSGVVDGYVREGEEIGGEVIRRLIPDGVYTWRITAVDLAGVSETLSGTLIVENGDAPLPEISELTVFPSVFTPNQDGISDRTAINVYLEKPAMLTVRLERDGIEPIILSQRVQDRRTGDAGRYLFDYDGGVDLGAEPPPDGEYRVVADAQDAVGQRVLRTALLIIQDGGKPLAEIVAQPTGATVVFEAQPYQEVYETARGVKGERIAPPEDPRGLSMNAITLPVGDMLVFKLTVENYSSVPIRTTGPAPGTVYQWDQRASTLGWFDESGAWRVGIDCTTAASDYPWRWALGDETTLQSGVDPFTGETFLYLPAGERAVVWGAVRMTEIEARNPQNCWAGLIHEDVEVSLRNNNVGARQIELVRVD